MGSLICERLSYKSLICREYPEVRPSIPFDIHRSSGTEEQGSHLAISGEQVLDSVASGLLLRDARGDIWRSATKAGTFFAHPFSSGEKREWLQVEDRLVYYEGGKKPRKNLAVMQEASEAAVQATVRLPVSLSLLNVCFPVQEKAKKRARKRAKKEKKALEEEMCEE